MARNFTRWHHFGMRDENVATGALATYLRLVVVPSFRAILFGIPEARGLLGLKIDPFWYFSEFLFCSTHFGHQSMKHMKH